MPQKQERLRLQKLLRVTAAALLAWTATVDPILAQAIAQAPAADAPPAANAPADAKVFSLADLEYLVGPIALYPDPLIALILPASTFPLQVVQADRWVATHADAIKKNDFSDADNKLRDTSVQALTRFPDVLQMMSDHLDLDAVARRRLRAAAPGHRQRRAVAARAGAEGRQSQDDAAAGGDDAPGSRLKRAGDLHRAGGTGPHLCAGL